MSTPAKPSPVPTAEAAGAVPRRDDDVRRKMAIRKAYHTAYYEYQRRDMMYLLIILRFVNAITIRTFFQPDEYFQSLEPAWEMAFGASSGAWITWVGISLSTSPSMAKIYRNGTTSFGHLCTPPSSPCSTL